MLFKIFQSIKPFPIKLAKFFNSITFFDESFGVIRAFTDFSHAKILCFKSRKLALKFLSKTLKI